MPLSDSHHTLKPKLYPKEISRGFSTSEMVIVLASIGILATMSIPLLTPVIEITEALIAEKYLLGAVKECQMGLINGEASPTYDLPSQSIGIGFNKTRRFEFLNSGFDGECLSSITNLYKNGNILSAARISVKQTFSTYQLNINLITGEKTTEGVVPAWLDWWDGAYSPLIPENDPLLQ